VAREETCKDKPDLWRAKESRACGGYQAVVVVVVVVVEPQHRYLASCLPLVARRNCASHLNSVAPVPSRCCRNEEAAVHIPACDLGLSCTGSLRHLLRSPAVAKQKVNVHQHRTVRQGSVPGS
jgi:hypothetical protein